MAELRIPHNALLLIADGRKALILENTGTPDRLAFSVIAEMGQSNPPTRAQGTDRPGRMADPAPGQRSAVAQTDFHQQAEDQFVREAVAGFAKEVDARGVKAALIAPPKALAVARAALPASLASALIGTLDKDLTKHPLGEIAKVLG